VVSIKLSRNGSLKVFFFWLVFHFKLVFKLFFYKDEVGDRARSNEHKRFISDEGLLAINKSLLRNPFQTRNKLKNDLNLIAKPRTISDAIRRLGWRKVPTRYCQIVEPRNCLKRFIYCCLCKKYKKKFENTIDADETTVELRLTGNANFTKPSVGLLTAAHGKIGKPKHNYKIHLFGGISRHGLTPLVMFTGRMNSEDYQRFMGASILPFIRTKLPYNHEFYMDNDPKHRSHSTESFMILHGINHFETPPQSPDLMPIEMVSF